MLLEKIRLVNFRNFNSETCLFPPGGTLLTGSNGSGKTNLLEAIYYSAFYRSFRDDDSRALVKKGAESFFIGLNYQTGAINNELEIIFHSGSGRKIKINNKKTGYAFQKNHLRVILLSGEDLQLVFQPPSRRRRFFDIIMSSLSANFRVNWLRYSQALKCRNQALKNKTNHAQWDEICIQYGTYIINARLKFISLLRPLMNELYARLGGKSGGAQIKYSDAGKNIFYEKSITEQEYAALLQTQAKHDFQYGYTVFGPHRDDFNFQIDSYPLAHYASQGEGRIFIYTLKLAAFQYMKKINSEYPLLLVDDIFSDLDSERISCIFNYIRTLPQFILACANISAINRHLAGFHIYVIKEGTIKHAADA